MEGGLADAIERYVEAVENGVWSWKMADDEILYGRWTAETKQAYREWRAAKMVAFDIAQADVRCLAHIVDSFKHTAYEYLDELRAQYESPTAWQYSLDKWDFYQPWNRGSGHPNPTFAPQVPCTLAKDFRAAKSDFYTVAATRMLGENDIEAAKTCLERFRTAYPQVAAFIGLMQHAFAISGKGVTFAGRPRRITPHWWMATEPYVDLLVSYRRADKLWVRVVPLGASRFVLTCRVLQVIDAKDSSPRKGREIYNDQQGRVSTAHYRFFEDDDHIFQLPIRNIPWKIIRRVRTQREEVRYEGFDRVRRQLFNHLCQGATADVVKRMMIRSVPVCREG